MDNEELVTNDDTVTESMTLTDSGTSVSLQQTHEDLLILMFIILFVFVYERVRIAIRSLKKRGD